MLRVTVALLVEDAPSFMVRDGVGRVVSSIIESEVELLAPASSLKLMYTVFVPSLGSSCQDFVVAYVSHVASEKLA